MWLSFSIPDGGKVPSPPPGGVLGTSAAQTTSGGKQKQAAGDARSISAARLTPVAMGTAT